MVLEISGGEALARMVRAFDGGPVSTTGPTVVDVAVTRDPARMLPGVDNRAAAIRKGDRIA